MYQGLKIMKVHKEKYERCVELLRKGYSYRRIAKELKLSITQISAIAKDLDLMIDLEVRKRKLKALNDDIRKREERINELKKTERILDDEISKKRVELTETIKLLEKYLSILFELDSKLQKFVRNKGVLIYASINENVRELVEKAEELHQFVEGLKRG